jgi:hypothetical protein
MQHDSYRKFMNFTADERKILNVCFMVKERNHIPLYANRVTISEIAWPVMFHSFRSGDTVKVM